MKEDGDKDNGTLHIRRVHLLLSVKKTILGKCVGAIRFSYALVMRRVDSVHDQSVHTVHLQTTSYNYVPLIIAHMMMVHCGNLL